MTELVDLAPVGTPVRVRALPTTQRYAVQMTKRKDPGYMTVADVAAKLGVGDSTVRAYVARGQAPEPDARYGRTPVWLPSTVDKWAANRPGRGRWGKGTPRPKTPKAAP